MLLALFIAAIVVTWAVGELAPTRHPLTAGGRMAHPA